MGAFGFAAGLASILRGQQQGQEATDVYRQKLQARQLEEQLKQMQLMARLREGQEAESAVTQLPKEAQPYARLGQLGPYMQQQRAAKANEASSVGFRASALRETDPGKRAALELAAEMAKLGVGESAIKEILRIGKVIGTGRANKFGQYQQAHPEMSIDDAIKGFRELERGTQTKLQFHWATETDPSTGRSISVRYSQAPDGTIAKREVMGMAKLSPLQQRALDAVESASGLGEKLKMDLAEIRDATPGQLGLQWAKYRAPFGSLGAVDPKFSAYFNDLGQIQTDLIGAATSGSSRAFQLVQLLKPHIPSPTDSPERALEKLQGFEAGRFKSLRKAILGVGASEGAPAAAGGGGSKPPRRPVYDTTGRIIGWTTDGKTMEPVH